MAFKVVPYCIALYNERMDGVDVVDQLMASYRRHQRNYKWTMTLFYSGIRMAVTTAYQLYEMYFYY